MRKFDKESYESFNYDGAKKWGMENYRSWLKDAQDLSKEPTTPAEYFFRYYKQGTGHMFNTPLRFGQGIDGIHDIDEIYLGGFTRREMIQAAKKEIESNKIQQNIVTYRFVRDSIIKHMLVLSGVRRLKKDVVIFDDGFLSTTLTPSSINKDRDYVRDHKKIFVICVQKGTPCVYLDFLSHLDENELLFLPKTKLRILSVKPLSKYIECVME
jgi:hypothetical protein